MKTAAAADQESLQASWWDRVSILPLRGRDILHLIDCGLKYAREGSAGLQSNDTYHTTDSY